MHISLHTPTWTNFLDIAIFHLDVSCISRLNKSTATNNPKPRSAVAGAAYRAGQNLLDEVRGRRFDYSKRKRIDSSIILAPDDVKGFDWVTNRAKLWNEVERTEKRKDAQLYREVKLCLQRELSPQQSKKLVVDFVKEHFVSRGMVADVSFHDIAENHNPHAHVMLTFRKVKADGSGFGKKEREWNNKSLVPKLRQSWEEVNNKLLTQINSLKLISCKKKTDSNPHISRPVQEMEKRGIKTVAYEKTLLAHLLSKLTYTKPTTNQKGVIKHLGIIAKHYKGYFSSLQHSIISQLKQGLQTLHNDRN